MAVRTPWMEAIERRRAMHQQAGPDSMETWAPADPAWMGLLEDTADDVIAARGNATSTRDPRDPRDALIDLIAVAGAWVDAFDQRNPVG